VFRPFLSLELQSGVSERPGGNPVQSSLSESALLDLWGKISSSLRVRPTESPKVSAREPPTPPLGTVASAGDTCPQSGWWLCGDGGEGIGVLGGQRQFIRQGQRMSQALLLPPQTLWEKLRGVQSSFDAKAPTSWKLVDRRTRTRIVPNVPLDRATMVTSDEMNVATAGADAIAVGTYATTGKACSASGWWRCEESHALDGTRWFAQGSLLPAATFAVPPAVFGKSSTGTPKTIQRRGKWMLVRLAQAPEAAGDAGEAKGSVTDQAGPDSSKGNAA
jgi:Tle cognate immunity protein 4 C-terminal domain